MSPNDGSVADDHRQDEENADREGEQVEAEGGADSDKDSPSEIPFETRAYRAVISIVILTGVTVVVGIGGWIILTITANLFGYDPKTEDGDPLRIRLRDWPEKNREVMRTNGRAELPWKP